MKSNLAYASLAMLLLASCSQDDVIQEMDTQQAEIGFSTFVDKASRAESTTTDNLETFKVWGTKFREGNSNAVRIMDGTVVTKSGDSWTYSPKKYWVNENAYSFTAIGSSSENITKNYVYNAPAITAINYDTYHTHYMGTLFYNNSTSTATYGKDAAAVNVAGAAGSADLIWASTKVETIPEEGVGPSSVHFTFGHLLSRVNLKFVNNRTIENPYVKIKNVKITSASTGTLNFADNTVETPSTDFVWSYSSAKFACPFAFPAANATGNPECTLNAGNNITTLNQFLIPSQESINVSFDCYTSVTAEDGEDGHINISKDIKFGTEGSPAPFQNVDLKPGYSYTLVAYLTDNLDNSGSINITVEVEEYIDNSAPVYGLSIKEPSVFNTSNDDDASAQCQTLSVEEVSCVNELVYYGTPTTRAEVTSFDDFNFEWSMPSNVNFTFDAESGLKGKPISKKSIKSPQSLGDLRVDIYCKGSYKPETSFGSYSGCIPVTLTMTDKSGKVLISNTIKIPITYTSSMTGGSMDGDDNDT